jgi:hypothetical protein
MMTILRLTLLYAGAMLAFIASYEGGSVSSSSKVHFEYQQL